MAQRLVPGNDVFELAQMSENGYGTGSASESEGECPGECSGKGTMVCAGCGCCACFVFLIILACSFKGLPATSYGIVQNSLTGRVNFDTVHEGGRPMIGFWNSFIEFPATIQSIEWLESHPGTESTKDLEPMQCRTADGLMVTLGVVAQYKITKDTIPEMYKDFRMGYEAFFISTLRSAFQVVLADFESELLWRDRDVVRNVMKETCLKVTKERMKDQVSCWSIQLLDIHLDKRIDDRIEERQVQLQNQNLETQKQIAALIRAKTSVLEAEYDKNITVVNAQASANAYKLRQTALADADFNWAAARAAALTIVQDKIQWQGTKLGSTDVNRYFEKMALVEAPQTELVYGSFDNSAVVTRGEL